jgi:hypothetical protein
MKFEIPLVIHDEPTVAEWVARYPDSRFQAKLAYRIAVKVWLRTRLSGEQNHRCAWCGCHTTELRDRKDSSTIEHVQPLSKGGADEYANMVMACSDCNQRRGVKEVTVFMAFVSKGKPVPAPSSKRLEVEFLRSNGIKASIKSKPGRLRRSVESVAVVDALRNGTTNPFEEGTRQWRTFNRYASSPNFEQRHQHAA